MKLAIIVGLEKLHSFPLPPAPSAAQKDTCPRLPPALPRPKKLQLFPRLATAFTPRADVRPDFSPPRCYLNI